MFKSKTTTHCFYFTLGIFIGWMAYTWNSPLDFLVGEICLGAVSCIAYIAGSSEERVI